MAREPLEIEATSVPTGSLEVDVLAVPVAEPPDVNGLAALDRRIPSLVGDGELRGKRGEVVLLHASAGGGPRRIALVGVGTLAELDEDAVRTAAAHVTARSRGVGSAALGWALGGLPLALSREARAVVEGAVLADRDAGGWKSTDERRGPLRRLVLQGDDAAEALDLARRAAVVATWTNRCRDLVNTPANELTPVRLAERAAEAAGEVAALRAFALGRVELEEEGFGAMLAVAKGSHNEPRLIVLEYQPPGANGDFVLGLVGKAITFDTGGISIKPAAKMEEMKGDMAGGAAVICGIAAVAALELPVRAIAVVPACENMPSGHATRPGDIVTALNGKTIEITNTDAEGRLVLADALVDIRRRGATHVLDLATLTGGVVVALGDFYAGLMGNDDAWLSQIEAAAVPSGDHVWRLPLHETWRRHIRSTFADMKNSSGRREASSAYGGFFLQQFAGDGPWAHLDIAGTAYLDRGRGDYYTAMGATGYGVRLIAALAEALAGR